MRKDPSLELATARNAVTAAILDQTRTIYVNKFVEKISSKACSSTLVIQPTGSVGYLQEETLGTTLADFERIADSRKTSPKRRSSESVL